MDKRNASTLGRRAFLQFGGGTAVVMSAGGRLDQLTAAASDSREGERQAGFRETEHVRTFYRVNRYPSRGSRPC